MWRILVLRFRTRAVKIRMAASWNTKSLATVEPDSKLLDLSMTHALSDTNP